MKINVQKNKDSKNYQIEIPSTVDLNHLSKGELFPVYLIDQKNIVKEVKACLLADGRSFLIENKIVRFNETFISKKNEIYRIGIGNNGLVSQNQVTANIVRPVKPRQSAANLGGGDIKSPMTGKIISILVKNNTKIKEGDTLIIIEAMKMENRIVAECDGLVTNVKINPGVSVAAGDLLFSITPEVQG
ncbi:biotin/lipoyl-containing protein [Silvanigrella sp.]|jgi:biotin carboxyl carrier protein|uniref:biotin/lipoyl-containing protein n=1 Tax=Silvanigrella sp. TaxID=2024976 RepID=UPI0037CB9D30